MNVPELCKSCARRGCSHKHVSTDCPYFVSHSILKYHFDELKAYERDTIFQSCNNNVREFMSAQR